MNLTNVIKVIKVTRNGLWADLLLVLVLALLLMLLRTLGPQESLKSSNLPRVGSPPHAAPPVPQRLALRVSSAASPAPLERPRVGTAFVGARDTINGERISDPAIIERIERIAAGVPSHLLARHSSAPSVRYLAHGFGAEDDAPIFYGLFEQAAAALAFGCALDDHLAERCTWAPVTAAAAYEELPGVRCVPLRLALGASAYEPDRCEASG